MDISERLQGFLGKPPAETVIRNTTLSFLEKQSITIPRSSIQIQKKNHIFLDISPIIKSRIITWFPELLNEINNELQEKGYLERIERIF